MNEPILTRPIFGPDGQSEPREPGTAPKPKARRLPIPLRPVGWGHAS